VHPTNDNAYFQLKVILFVSCCKNSRENTRNTRTARFRNNLLQELQLPHMTRVTHIHEIAIESVDCISLWKNMVEKNNQLPYINILPIKRDFNVHFLYACACTA